MLIKKDNQILDVTKGAYRATFAAMGWEPAAEADRPARRETPVYMSPAPAAPAPKREKKPPITFEEMAAQAEPESAKPQAEEKPTPEYELVLSDMTLRELTDYANANRIPLHGATRKADVIALIDAARKGEI